MIAAFQAEPDIYKAVKAFCEATVNNGTAESRSGCMMAAAVLGPSERVKEIRSYAMQGLAASADVLAQRFQREMKAGTLTPTPSAKVRGRALIDLMQVCCFAPKRAVRGMNCSKTPAAMCPSFLESKIKRVLRQ